MTTTTTTLEMEAAIQLSIMVGGLFGGVLVDELSMAAPLIGGTVLRISKFSTPTKK